MVQWLELGASTDRAQVQSPVRELRPCKPYGTARKEKSQRISLIVKNKN